MATNVTKDHIDFMEQQLKTSQIHLEKAEQRLANAKEKLKINKALNPKKYAEREDLPDENAEIRNLRIKIAHYEFAIEAMKEKIIRDDGISVIDKLPDREIKNANINLVNKQIGNSNKKKKHHHHQSKK